MTDKLVMDLCVLYLLVHERIPLVVNAMSTSAPFSQPNYTAVASTCNLWRTGDDVDDSWHSVSSIIDFYAGNQGGFAQVAEPGIFAHALADCSLLAS